MKLKLLALIFTFIFAFSLAGCGEDTSKNNSDNMMSDIKNGMDTTESKVESGIDSAGSKVESGINSGESMLQNGTVNDADAKITQEKAKQIALEDAKLKESDIKNYRIKLDRDDGILVYELEFDHNGYEYDYEIDANSGTIRERDKDRLD